MRKYPIFLIVLALAAALILPAGPARAQGDQDIVAIASSDPQFSTLVAALQAADLVETLQGEGPFTVFAPTNDAFAAALDALGLTADELLADTDTLTQILLYHVVPGAVTADQVVTLDSATTAQGSDISIAVQDGTVVLNDSVNVVATDIMASNGVIHVIDGVLLPPAATESADAGLGYIRVAHFSPDTPAVEIYVNGALSDIQALNFGDVSGWVELPAGTYELAVAPTGTSYADAAIGPLNYDLQAGTWNTIAAVGSLEAGTLTAQVVQEDYSPIAADSARVTILHAIEDAPAVDVLAGGEPVVTALAFGDDAATLEVPAGTYDLQVVPSGATEPVVLDLSGTELMPHTYYFVAATGTLDNPGVTVEAIEASLLADNTTGYPADDMSGDEMSEDASMGSIVDIAVADGRFTTLVAAVQAAGLADTLAGDGPFTVFAPTDDAFAAALDALGLTADELLADTDTLTSILLYHVADGALTAADVAGMNSIPTLNGAAIAVDASSNVVLNDGQATVILANIMASNGVIHVIDGVLLPPSN
ncbi:MAG TPA: fasciclin domain-containing protein [Aggregatilinea sp.]|uniref:fasciclin domain-containing protein n=1 Tax=Aggregatilinea sp. TaxID=2806333 RepID=UPI002C0ACEE8|nr:fasciclin domain-containing protein [Aggregatilinea sp.]HML23059.1 fasciclin domain-containing protein [Aggregatilinea sp.]